MAIASATVAGLAVLAPGWTLAAPVAQTQSNATRPAGVESPRFDAASVKPSFSDSVMNVKPFPNRLTADATLQILMQYAYGVQLFQLLGGPRWLTSARYEIDATADAPVARDRLFVMLQALLEDRFQLRTHREMRDLPAFAVIAAPGGLKLPTPRDGGCADSAAEAGEEWAGGRLATPGELQPANGRCGSARVGLDPRAARMQVTGGRIAMPEFTRLLSLLVGRVVLDQTNYNDLFDVELNFVPDASTPALPPPPPDSGISGASIATALQQQLGLRLEPTRTEVELIVVDRASPPAAN
jgi:uncharacterized protein (TIGR03435 family)